MFHLSLDVPDASTAIVIAQLAEVYLVAIRFEEYDPDPEFLEKALERLMAQLADQILPDGADHLFTWSHEVNRGWLMVASLMERCACEIRRHVSKNAGAYSTARDDGATP